MITRAAGDFNTSKKSSKYPKYEGFPDVFALELFGDLYFSTHMRVYVHASM